MIYYICFKIFLMYENFILLLKLYLLLTLFVRLSDFKGFAFREIVIFYKNICFLIESIFGKLKYEYIYLIQKLTPKQFNNGNFIVCIHRQECMDRSTAYLLFFPNLNKILIIRLIILRFVIA